MHYQWPFGHGSFPTQVDVVLACCIINNFIIGANPLDSIMNNELLDSSFANESTSKRFQLQREVQEKKYHGIEWFIQVIN